MRSLRVLFLATRDWYNPATTGGDNTLWENARYLASRGHRVTYLCGSFPGAAADVAIDGIHLMRTGAIHWLWLRSFLYWISHRNDGTDVVITEGFGGSRVPRLAPLYIRVPVITAWHQTHRDLFAAQYPRLLTLPLNLLERVTAWVHRNTYVQAYTTEWASAFTTLGFRPDKIFVVPVCLREEWLIAGQSHRPVSEPHIVWIGKLRRYKCPDHMIRALPIVLESIPAARLTIIGRHDDRAYELRLRQLVEELQLGDKVEFRPDVTEAGKAALLRQSRVLAITSAVEGFGIVTLEANAFGIPVVASSGVPESVVRNGLNGLRYNFANTDELAERIISVLSDDALYDKLSAGSRQNAKEFAWARVGAAFEAALFHAVDNEADAGAKHASVTA